MARWLAQCGFLEWVGEVSWAWLFYWSGGVHSQLDALLEAMWALDFPCWVWWFIWAVGWLWDWGLGFGGMDGSEVDGLLVPVPIGPPGSAHP